MNQLVKLLFASAFTLMLFQCAPYQPEGQGVVGLVTWLEGNQMPTIAVTGKKNKNTTIGEPVKRTLRIYPLMNISDVTLENGLFKSVAAKPITEVETDENGQYTVNLSPGRYSILTVEEGGLFANIFDGEGNIQPVTVKENEWTLLDVVVNYKAAY
ncbi:carboxypeptidase regulatory-like domain-containing protein [Algoriphagus sp. C2-6-M1]|uniref:carboxypeptidase regulatory-like domain-containing protein n=1 Tax=Algoriphagus persicinus TaxID=3108754 RepID=UPI002B3B762F|nr:carboxypeptidase regulatory-like domain-containing protein [Algoriphagus sp. C2-6-M1]MEB2781287.1 carboxypeptidase regulatory-like domain-containing protein [Algoriphagus sp. C2-6-M1]